MGLRKVRVRKVTVASLHLKVKKWQWQHCTCGRFTVVHARSITFKAADLLTLLYEHERTYENIEMRWLPCRMVAWMNALLVPSSHFSWTFSA